MQRVRRKEIALIHALRTPRAVNELIDMLYSLGAKPSPTLQHSYHVRLTKLVQRARCNGHAIIFRRDSKRYELGS